MHNGEVLRQRESTHQKGNEVELCCCWAGDYESNFDNVEAIETSDKDFKDKFEIE